MDTWWKRLNRSPWAVWGFATLFMAAAAWFQGGPYWPAVVVGAGLGLWQAGWNQVSSRLKESRWRRLSRFVYRFVPFLSAMLALRLSADRPVDWIDLTALGGGVLIGALLAEWIISPEVWP